MNESTTRSGSGDAPPPGPAVDPCREPTLADLCSDDPLDLDRDPRLRGPQAEPARPCGALCTPWCLGEHG